ISAAVRTNQIAYTKARCIARITADKLNGDESEARKLRRDLLDRVIAEGLSVRDLKAEVARILGTADAPPVEDDLIARIQRLATRLAEVNVGSFDSSRRGEISAAVDALMRLLPNSVD